MGIVKNKRHDRLGRPEARERFDPLRSTGRFRNACGREENFVVAFVVYKVALTIESQQRVCFVLLLGHY